MLDSQDESLTGFVQQSLLDASIVPVPSNHNTRNENAAIKNGEVPEDWADKPSKRSQKDVDARWAKKHGKSHYGYKNHVNADRKHKLVRRYHVSDAALHDSQAVDHLLMQGNTGGSLGGSSLPLRGDGSEAARPEAEKPHPPQGHARQAAD